MSQTEALELLRRNVARFDDEDIRKSFAKWRKVVQYSFTDTNEKWHISIDQGSAELHQGEAAGTPEVEFIMTTETCAKLGRGELNAMAAYSSGAIKAKGAVRDLIKWRKVSRAD